MTNRFKGLDLINRLPEELWTEVRDTVQEAVIKTIPKKKKCKKGKWLSEEALQIAMKKRGAKSKGEKERYTHLTAEQETRLLDPCAGKIPWKGKWQPTPIFLPGESHGQRSLVGLQSMESQEPDMT